MHDWSMVHAFELEYDNYSTQGETVEWEMQGLIATVVNSKDLLGYAADLGSRHSLLPWDPKRQCDTKQQELAGRLQADRIILSMHEV